jgi:hypothetical protein
MQIIIAHEFMMCRRMVFKEVICTVGAPRGPVKIELPLSNAIFEPMITHVKGFRSLSYGLEHGVCHEQWNCQSQVEWQVVEAPFQREQYAWEQPL